MLYLFILAILMNVFTYMFYSSEVKFGQERYDKTTKKLRDSIQLVKTQLADANYFSLEHNENAQKLYIANGFEVHNRKILKHKLF